jgi:hypothetical protein
MVAPVCQVSIDDGKQVKIAAIDPDFGAAYGRYP